LRESPPARSGVPWFPRIPARTEGCWAEPLSRKQNLAFFCPPPPNGFRISGWRRAVSRKNICVPVNFSSRPLEPEAFGEDGKVAGGCANRRAELWKNLKRALEAGRFQLLPDDNSLQADLVSVGYKHDSSGRILLESKNDMKKRGIPSPDLGDAVALIFGGTAGASVVSISHGYRSRGFHRRSCGSTGWIGT
jgi:hypothetical protein